MDARRRCPIKSFLAAVFAASSAAALSSGSPRVDVASGVQRLLRERDARGAVMVLEVRTGAVVAAAGLGRDVAAPVLPLSIVKLYVAAAWWDHEFGEGSFPHPGSRGVTVHEILVHGWDRPAEVMAVTLRRRIGGERMLAELARYGLGAPPGTLTLPSGADDATWGESLSIGERHMTVTLPGVSRFLLAIALDGGGVMKPRTARRLQSAMRDTVARGTARGAAGKLAGSRWELGGKTGTGPSGPPVPDGWFAGLIFERGRPRYTAAVYIDAHGPGGGMAASIAADVARLLR